MRKNGGDDQPCTDDGKKATRILSGEVAPLPANPASFLFSPKANSLSVRGGKERNQDRPRKPQVLLAEDMLLEFPSSPPQGSLALEPENIAGDFFIMQTSPGVGLPVLTWTPPGHWLLGVGGWNMGVRESELRAHVGPCRVTLLWGHCLTSVRELLEWFPSWSAPEACANRTGPTVPPAGLRH